MHIMDHLTQEQAAEFLGVNQSQLKSLCRRRLLAYYSPSRGIRLFLLEDLKNFLETRRMEARLWSIEERPEKVGGSLIETRKAANTRKAHGQPKEPPSWRNVN